MQIGEYAINLTSPPSPELLELYQCKLRWLLIHHESLVSNLHLAVYFKSANDLREVPVLLAADEIANLLLSEVLFFLNLSNSNDTIGVKNDMPSFIRYWWSNNHIRFCRAFFPLLGNHQGEAEQYIDKMLTNGP